MRNITIHITAKSIALLLAAAALVWLIANFSSILLMLFLAILLAVAITPLVNVFEQRRIPRTLAIVLIYIALLSVVAVALGVLVPVLIQEIGQLSASLPQLTERILAMPGSWLATYFPALGQTFQVNDLVQQLSAQIGAVVGSFGTLLVSFGSALSTIILDTLLVLVVGFILTSDAHFAPHFIARFFPPRYRPTATKLAYDIGGRLGHWVRAQLLVCLFYGVCFGLGLGLLGVPYAFALGLAAAILELIPYVGGAIVTAVAMLVGLSVSPWLALGCRAW